MGSYLFGNKSQRLELCENKCTLQGVSHERAGSKTATMLGKTLFCGKFHLDEATYSKALALGEIKEVMDGGVVKVTWSETQSKKEEKHQSRTGWAECVRRNTKPCQTYMHFINVSHRRTRAIGSQHLNDEEMDTLAVMFGQLEDDLDAKQGRQLALPGQQLALGGQQLSLGGQQLALGGQQFALGGQQLSLGGGRASSSSSAPLLALTDARAQCRVSDAGKQKMEALMAKAKQVLVKVEKDAEKLLGQIASGDTMHAVLSLGVQEP